MALVVFHLYVDFLSVVARSQVALHELHQTAPRGNCAKATNLNRMLLKRVRGTLKKEMTRLTFPTKVRLREDTTKRIARMGRTHRTLIRTIHAPCGQYIRIDSVMKRTMSEARCTGVNRFYVYGLLQWSYYCCCRDSIWWLEAWVCYWRL